MLRKIARLLDRLSPAFGQFARQTYLAFRHRQLHGLIRSAINWQTNYLEKKQLESSCLSFATQESIARLKSEEPKGKPSIAVIAPMPPASTGIAWYTLSSFLAASYCVDIYAHYESIDDYLNAVQDARLTGSNVRIFSTDALPTGRMTNAYKAQVFIVGNSDHNVRVGRALWRLAEFPTNLPTYVYIHDPCLLNIVAILCREFNISFEGLLRKQYGAKLDASPRSMGFNHRELIERHVYGPKALLNEVKVDGIIVNSTAAADLVQKDFPELDRRKIHKLFNPVCRPPPAPEAHASDGRPENRHLWHSLCSWKTYRHCCRRFPKTTMRSAER